MLYEVITKEERNNRQQCISTDADNIKKLLRVMSQQRLQLEELILDAQKMSDTQEEIRLRKDARALSDEMAKQNKTLLSLDKTNYTLGTYIDVMDDIFNALRVYDESLWEKTVDFQATLIVITSYSIHYTKLYDTILPCNSSTKSMLSRMVFTAFWFSVPNI